jgi:hypothetical protein
MGTVTEMLKKMGCELKNGMWRLYITTGGSPFVLTNTERAWNERGGRPLGTTPAEAIRTIDAIWGLEYKEFTADEITFAQNYAALNK